MEQRKGKARQVECLLSLNADHENARLSGKQRETHSKNEEFEWMEGMRQSSSVQPKGATRFQDMDTDLDAAMAEAARTLKSCSGQQKTVINKGNWSKEVKKLETVDVNISSQCGFAFMIF